MISGDPHGRNLSALVSNIRFPSRFPCVVLSANLVQCISRPRCTCGRRSSHSLSLHHLSTNHGPHGSVRWELKKKIKKNSTFSRKKSPISVRVRGGGIFRLAFKRKNRMFCEISRCDSDPFFTANPFQGLTFYIRQKKGLEFGFSRPNAPFSPRNARFRGEESTTQK